MNHKVISSENEDNRIKKRIGLITPYQGFNFGDGAIQDTILHNLKNLDASVECFGITLYPADTENRHGITSIPITGLVVRNYSEPELLFTPVLLPPQGSLNDNQTEKTINDVVELPLSTRQKFVERLRGIKNLPLLGNILRYAVFRLRDAKKIFVELREFTHAYKFARNLDLLVLAGGGQLDEAHGGSWGHPYVMFRWALISKLTQKPFAIVSTGSAKLESGLTRWFVKNTLRSAVYRSYRDVGTRNQLSHLKFTQNDPIVRDLALGLDPAPYLNTQTKNNSQRIIAVSPIYHSDPRYTTYDDFVEGIADFIQWLVERGDRVLLFRTTLIDRLVIRDIWRNLSLRFEDEIPDAVEEVEADCYQDLLKKIVVSDLVVASRLHSIILSHVLRKPTLAISWDRKVEAHMEDMEQTQYMIDIHSLNSTIIKSIFKELESDAEKIRDALHTHISSFQEDINIQYKYLLQLAAK
jgi:polysaccharide pyruvyl transferase WcaK-like protein